MGSGTDTERRTSPNGPFRHASLRERRAPRVRSYVREMNGVPGPVTRSWRGSRERSGERWGAGMDLPRRGAGCNGSNGMDRRDLLRLDALERRRRGGNREHEVQRCPACQDAFLVKSGRMHLVVRMIHPGGSCPGGFLVMRSLVCPGVQHRHAGREEVRDHRQGRDQRAPEPDWRCACVQHGLVRYSRARRAVKQPPVLPGLRAYSGAGTPATVASISPQHSRAHHLL